MRIGVVTRDEETFNKWKINNPGLADNAEWIDPFTLSGDAVITLCTIEECEEYPNLGGYILK